MPKRFVLLLVLLAVPSLFAQSVPLSTLQGKVTADGSPLPGVTVSATSPNLQGTRTANTTSAGDYLLPFLPPGEYKITFELAGMQTVTRRVTLTAARSDRIDIALRPAAVAEAITVTADTPLTAVVESTQVATNFKQDLIEQLPVGRSLQSITLLAPGVNSNGPGGNIMISGAMSFDSLYLVDGAIVNENLRGQAHNLFIEDAIQETTVHTGGISAEYGHFTGGVVNAITKSGGNEFKGSFRSSLSNESWTARTIFTVDQEDKINPFYEATLGGPIMRDRIWFFAAGRSAKTSDIRQTVPGLARQGDQNASGQQLTLNSQIPPITYPHGTKETRLEGKFTGAITPKHNVIATILDIKASETNQTGQAIMDLDSLVANRRTPNSFYALNYNGALTQNFFVEAQYSKKKFAFLGSGSPYFDIVKGTLITDRARGTRFWSPTFRATEDGEHRDHDLYTAKASYFWSTPNFGSHEIKAGYEHFLEVRDVNNYQNGSDYRISISQSIVRGNQIFGRFGGGATGTATRISWLPILVLSQGSDYASDSFFINDRWTLNDHWSFNLGARYDKNDAMSGDGSFQIAKDSAISPRLGLNYDVFANGKLTVIASWGKYVGRLSEGVGNDADPAGRNASFQWDYRGPSINNDVNAPTASLVPTDKAIQMIFDWFFQNGGTNRRPFRTPPSVPGIESILDPGGLTSPNVTETAVGVASLLGTRGYVRADAIWRDWNDFYTSFVDRTTGRVTDNFGTTFDQAVIRNDSDLYDRKYYAVQTQFSYRFLPQFTLGGTYTWSRLLGNVTGEDSGSGPLVGVAGERPEYRQESWNYPMGYLTGDQRHRARLWANYDLSLNRFGELNFSVLQNFDSGTRTSIDGTIDPSPYVTNPGYVSVPTGVSYFFGGRGILKTDDITRTDIAIGYRLRLLRGVDFFIQPEIINVFNRKGVQSFDEEVLTNSDTATLKAFNPFTETPQLGVHYALGPTFGQPNSEGDFQTPRTYRMSLGLRF
jgi:Carboxypeptidase regulatory-like domain/TonB dependent receptor/TonB-dependent Receptor Plug Domain